MLKNILACDDALLVLGGEAATGLYHDALGNVGVDLRDEVLQRRLCVMKSSVGIPPRRTKNRIMKYNQTSWRPLGISLGSSQSQWLFIQLNFFLGLSFFSHEIMAFGAKVDVAAAPLALSTSACSWFEGKGRKPADPNCFPCQQ